MYPSCIAIRYGYELFGKYPGIIGINVATFLICCASLLCSIHLGPLHAWLVWIAASGSPHATPTV